MDKLEKSKKKKRVRDLFYSDESSSDSPVKTPKKKRRKVAKTHDEEFDSDSAVSASDTSFSADSESENRDHTRAVCSTDPETLQSLAKKYLKYRKDEMDSGKFVI